jgi:hypothetical protein
VRTEVLLRSAGRPFESARDCRAESIVTTAVQGCAVRAFAASIMDAVKTVSVAPETVAPKSLGAAFRCFPQSPEEGYAMSKMLVRSVAAATLAFALALPVGATTYAEMTDREMTVQSDAIVVARVAQSKSQWIGKQLVTVVDMRVSETLKGDQKTTMQVVLPGGADLKRKIPVSMSYPGAPTLRQGESVVLFLNKTSLRPGAMVISGFSQGKYNVVTDQTGEAVVTRSATDAPKGARSFAATPGTEKRRTLSDFRAEINDYLAKPKR